MLPHERRPERIPPFCVHLMGAWGAVPDMRFGQFIENVQNEVRLKGLDPFYVEDDQMSKFIDDMVARMSYVASGKENHGQ